MALAEQSPGTLDPRSLGRYREVLGVLLRYGLSELVENFARGKIVSPRISPRAIREALCELGPAFVKLGQMLSARDELLSPAFREELAKLQDQVTPFSFEIVTQVIESELKAGLGELFLHVEPTPIASGSIGQVHRACLLDGTDVVIKVQRPGLEAVLASDTAIIQQLFGRFGSHPEMGDHASRLIGDFLETIQTELDYAREADQIDRFAWQFEHDPKIRVPRLIRPYSTRRVLTMTYLAGKKLSEIQGYTPAGKTVAQRLAATILKQIFAYRFFHGDPHAANVIVTSDESIGFYDFGLVGELSVVERECVANLLLALLQQQPEAATETLVQLTLVPLAVPSTPLNRPALQNDLALFMKRYFRQPVPDIQVHRLLEDILRITTKYGLILPAGFYLVFRVLATLDSVGRKLDPGFDLASLALPVLRRAKSSGPPEQVDAAKFFEIGAETLQQLHGLPVALRNTFHQLSQGQLRIQFEHRGLEDVVLCYDRAGKRLGSVIFVAILTLGGYGLICSAILARAISIREATIAGAALACLSGSLVFWFNRRTGVQTRTKRGRQS